MGDRPRSHARPRRGGPRGAQAGVRARDASSLARRLRPGAPSSPSCGEMIEVEGSRLPRRGRRACSGRARAGARGPRLAAGAARPPVRRPRRPAEGGRSGPCPGGCRRAGRGWCRASRPRGSGAGTPAPAPRSATGASPSISSSSPRPRRCPPRAARARAARGVVRVDTRPDRRRARRRTGRAGLRAADPLGGSAVVGPRNGWVTVYDEIADGDPTRSSASRARSRLGWGRSS